MSEQWGTREQPSDRDSGLRAEHAYLLLSAFNISAAIILYIVDNQAPFDVNRGAYAILVSFFIVGYCGWLSRSAERRMRRIAVAELRRLATAVEELQHQVRQQQRTTYLPAPRRTHEGQRYIGAVAVGAEDDATQHNIAGIDPDSIAAARRISNRLRSVENE